MSSEEGRSPQRDVEIENCNNNFIDSSKTDNKVSIADSVLTQNIDEKKTPCKDIKINLFTKGVTCTSTPLHQCNLKSEIENLSVIKEEDEEIDEPDISNLTKDPSNKVFPVVLDHNIVNDISNFSVLRKDELSLLLDLPNDTVQKEEEVKFKKENLTLSVNNFESVVYKNIIDKTVDDLLIDEDLTPIKKINSFETECDRKLILEKATALKEFVSSDAAENKDNNDPEWELLKKLETDDERYKAVRKIWRNLAIPDLKQNLSTFNWRKRNSLPALKNVAPIKINEIDKKKKKFTYDCTEVFDVGIKKLYDFYERQIQGINLDCDNETSLMTSIKKKPRLETGYMHNRRRNFQSDLEKLKGCVHERLQRHQEAKKEIEAVHGFYNGLKNQDNGGYGNIMKISHMELQSILDIENMVNSYVSWYPDHA